MYLIICKDCGYYSELSNEAVRSMYREYKNGYKKYGLPEVIYCGNCSNHGDESICEVIYRGDDN